MNKRTVFVLVVFGLVVAFLVGLVAYENAKNSRPVPSPRSSLYVKGAPEAPQIPGYVCQNELNTEMPSGYEPICYPAS